MSTVKARAKRTLPSLPAKRTKNVGVVPSPSSSPLSLQRKFATNSPSNYGTDRPKSSKLPIRRTHSMNELSKSVAANDNLRKKALSNTRSDVISRGVTKCNGTRGTLKKSGANDETDNAKTIHQSALKNVNKNENVDEKFKGTQNLSKTRDRSSPDGLLRTLTKSESVNSLDSLSVGSTTVEEEPSCVTVAVRVRPFNQRYLNIL